MPAYLMWGFVHVMYLIGWGNRLGTVYTWARALTFTQSRAHRIITFERARYEVTGGTSAEIPPDVSPAAREQAG